MNVYDSGQIKQKAKAIEDAMERFKDKGKSIKMEVEGLRDYWQDPVNKEYLKKFSEFELNIPLMEKHMREYADYLREVAKRIEISTEKINRNLR